MDPAPGLVVVGHVTKDANEGGYRLGGAAYAALTAARLGHRVALMTSYGPDLDPGPALRGVEIHCRSASTSTVFRNDYTEGRRVQTVLSVAPPLDASQVLPAWRGAPVLLAPMAGEIGPDLLDAFAGSPRVGACPQGWMRRWGPDGRVVPAPWAWADEGLRRIDAVIVSLDDLGGDETITLDWACRVGCLVLTMGEDGARVHCQERREHIPAIIRSGVVDPTGAGDAFAAAFLLKWHETGDPFLAGRFASLVASFVVQRKGLDGVPTRNRVEESWHRITSAEN